MRLAVGCGLLLLFTPALGAEENTASEPGRPARADLKSNLDLFRNCAAGLLRFSDSRTDTLMRLQRSGLAGLLGLFMVGLAVHERQPVWVRYFRIEPDGSLHYYSAEEIKAMEKQQARAALTEPSCAGWKIRACVT